MITTRSILLLLLLPFTSRSQPVPPRPAAVNKVLASAGRNRKQLEKAIRYFTDTHDAQKIRAIYFLIGNMDIHYSLDYYWADKNGKRIPYRELDYPSSEVAQKALAALQQRYGPLHPVTVRYNDADTISADFLIANTQMAFAAWHRQEHPCSFEDFCEYILPYRVSNEPIEDWREAYSRRFAVLAAHKGVPADSTLCRIGRNIRGWFADTYGVEEREDPLPRLGAMQLLFRHEGACEDIADLASLIARCNGIPSAVDYVAAWATATGLHYLDYVNVNGFSKHHFDAADNDVVDTLAREPAKVVRTTWSRQTNIPASMVDTAQIPPGYLRVCNFKDVTREYWATGDVLTQLTPLKGPPASLAYAAVWNHLRWKPVWFSRIDGNRALFTNMCKGAVYLPMYYLHSRLVPAYWPVVLGYNNTYVLKTDTIHTRTLHITEQAKYLSFRTGKKYTLYYWNGRWIKSGVKIAGEKETALVYEKVPGNALLLLLPEYTKGKERPFIMLKDNTRLWF